MELCFAVMQAISPMKTLDELHVCEMPAWPCFPSPEDRKLSPQSSEAKDLDNSTSVSMDPILRLKQGTHEKLRCFVVTARARSFLYHQVMFALHADVRFPFTLSS
jgi:tRNA pseudouridine38-40 synthase